MNAVLSGLAQSFANYLPVVYGTITYIHADGEEQRRMRNIVLHSLAIGTTVSAGFVAGSYAVNYGLRQPLEHTVIYVVSHTVAYTGYLVQAGILAAVSDLFANRIFRPA